MLTGKRIVIGITGGIAAYKSIELIRLLKKANAEVRVVLTDSAEQFVTPLTLQAISGNSIANSLFDLHAELAMGHIELAKWADYIVIAPATANTIAKFTHGISDNLLTTICLATTAPILVAPAMNQQMYRQSIVQQNIAQLTDRGVQFIGPNSGEQACGDIGAGRMAEPVEIFDKLVHLLNQAQPLKGIAVTITAGPTREAIDPVRFISNHSSGKMGYALAQAFAEQGAMVHLISGPVTLSTPINIIRHDVESAQQMYQKSLELSKTSDIFIGCAAVADYRMQTVAKQKLKKTADVDELTLKLVKNPDIIATIASLDEHRPFVVGFAAETENVIEYAQNKLIRKNLDMICANDVANKENGFNSDNNALTVLWPHGKITLPSQDKLILSRQLVTIIHEQFQRNKDTF